jgi:hypothetical protein
MAKKPKPLKATRKFIRGTLVVQEPGELSDEQMAKLDPETAAELIAQGLLEGDPEAAEEAPPSE